MAAAPAGEASEEGDKGIYEAVSKVLEGYDWTLVPMLNRWVLDSGGRVEGQLCLGGGRVEGYLAVFER